MSEKYHAAKTKNELDPGLTNPRWEKGVEVALANELQAWYVECMMAKSFKKMGTFFNTDVSEWCRTRRYLPLDGNVEKDLGDAIVKAGTRFILLECKEDLNTSNWANEASSSSIDENEKVTHRRKNRGKKLADLRTAHPDIEIMGKLCHFIVGMHKADGARTLKFADYWDFILSTDKGRSACDKSRPIFNLQKHGLKKTHFTEYIKTLRETSSADDQDWLEREIVLMTKNASGWAGMQMKAIDLKNFLGLAATPDATHENDDAQIGARKRFGKTS
jgi:hypothetical protein